MYGAPQISWETTTAGCAFDAIYKKIKNFKHFQGLGSCEICELSCCTFSDEQGGINGDTQEMAYYFIYYALDNMKIL